MVHECCLFVWGSPTLRLCRAQATASYPCGQIVFPTLAPALPLESAGIEPLAAALAL
jgi:hypothetical protein